MELGPQGSATPETCTHSLPGLALPVLLALGGRQSQSSPPGDVRTSASHGDFLVGWEQG